MTKEQCEEQCEEQCLIIRERANKEIRLLRNNFAMGNAEYGVGDIIYDHYHIIIVKKVTPYGTDCIYVGEQLNKDLSVSKRQLNTRMYSTNIEGKLN